MFSLCNKTYDNRRGGILCTNDKKYLIFVNLRNHGMIDRDTHIRLGYNYRMMVNLMQLLGEFN